MTNGLGLSKLGKALLPYPTRSEYMRRLADTYNRTRLTPLAQALMSDLVTLCCALTTTTTRLRDISVIVPVLDDSTRLRALLDLIACWSPSLAR